MQKTVITGDYSVRVSHVMCCSTVKWNTHIVYQKWINVISPSINNRETRQYNTPGNTIILLMGWLTSKIILLFY